MKVYYEKYIAIVLPNSDCNSSNCATVLYTVQVGYLGKTKNGLFSFAAVGVVHHHASTEARPHGLGCDELQLG